MKGIVGHAVRLPAHRIARAEIARAWESATLTGHKRCIAFDEDSLTLAAAATQSCLSTLEEPTASGLMFASTTAPYLERLNASLIAAVCDLPPDCSVADLSSSLRAGTTGLLMALGSLDDDAGRPVVVCAGETRDAEPGSAEEVLYGDAGAAIAVGRQSVIAEFVAGATTYDDFFDSVRRDRDIYVTSFASKFSTDQGYVVPLSRALGEVMKKVGTNSKEIARLVVPSPDRRGYLQLAKKLGFAESQLQDIAFDDGGLTGAAMPLALLSGALESAEPGDLILWGAYGNGADALLFRATDRISSYKPHIPVAIQRSLARDYSSYTLYRKAREFFRAVDQNLEITNIFYAKEERQSIRLHGSECGHCKIRQFPIAQVCVGCRKSDGLQEVALERHGIIFTFAVDTLNPSPFPPTVTAVVDLHGGGRIHCEVVDVDPSTVKIGMPVELTIRKLREGGGLYHYYWKCYPARSV